MKKICYVVTIPLTIRSFFIPQLKYLADNNFEVYVICSFDECLEKELGEKINYIPLEIPRGISVGGSVKAIRKLKNIFKREKFDLVQYSTPNAALYASIAAKRAKIKVRNYHLMGFRYLGVRGIGRKILFALEKISCHNSTHIECVSKSNLEMGIAERIFSREKATVVWNGSSGGVDLRRFDYSKRDIWRSEIRNELGYSEDDYIYGFVGRITKDKGINELLEAFIKLRDDSKLLLLGPMEGIATLDAEVVIKAKDNENIQFHEAVKDVERYYAALDVLLLPSYREGFGNVVIEAGAVGTPAIVTDIPGPTDTVIRNKTALVVPVKNSQKLLEAMQRIRMQDSMDMGIKANQFVVSHFDGNILNKKVLERKMFLLEE